MNVTEPDVALINVLVLISLVLFSPNHFLEVVKGYHSFRAGFLQGEIYSEVYSQKPARQQTCFGGAGGRAGDSYFLIFLYFFFPFLDILTFSEECRSSAAVW